MGCDERARAGRSMGTGPRTSRSRRSRSTTSWAEGSSAVAARARRYARRTPTGALSVVAVASRSLSPVRQAEGESMSSDESTFEGQCFCGAVRIEVAGDPVGAGYCHCASCRSWSAGPVNAFTLWKPEAVKVTQGEHQIGEHHKNERRYRHWCKVCRGHFLSPHPQWDLVHAYPATIPLLPFLPGLHVNYEPT